MGVIIYPWCWDQSWTMLVTEAHSAETYVDYNTNSITKHTKY